MKKLVVMFLVISVLIIFINFTSAQNCTDSDGGKDYYTPGVATGIYAGAISSVHLIYGTPDFQPGIQLFDGPGETIYYDHCGDSVQLNEAFCGSDGRLNSIANMCPNGCENGVCIPEVGPECPGIPISRWCPDEITLCPMATDEQGCSVWDCDSCTETIPEPETCAASIKIYFSQDVYYEGDYAKFTVEVFDSQGNKIPNYPFYSAIYEYSTDHWDYASSPTMTNNEGYFEFGKVVGEGDSKGKILYKAYTKATESCPTEVEDSIETEFRDKENGVPPEPRPETCAARISISFDKNVYYVGEEFKVVMEIFDAQGNHLPHYPFYIKVYDYEKGMWHTSFEDDRTDGDGYRIHQDKMSLGEPFRFGKNKLKIYTDVGGCNLVEDIAIIEVKRRERPEPIPCGMGNCVPAEPIGGEPINISDGRGFYSCSGCEDDEKCYPVGYRKSGQYCDVDNEFISQIEKGECDNSFECESNVCISGECLTENFIEKIIAWFKKLFGGEDGDGVEKKCSKLLIEKDIGDYRYEQSMHGEDEHTQAPLFSEDGEYLGTIKCCAAIYKDKEDTERGVLFCAYDNKEDVTNSVKWLIAKERDIVFKEYEGEKVFGDDEGQVVAWINNAYLIAVGVGPAEKNTQLPEDIANAYLKKYPSEFELTEDDIPDAPPSRPWVYCTEEDKEKGYKCESQPGARLQTDPHPDEDCEVYVGCILPHEKCESMDDIAERNNCYVGVAEMTGDSSVCEKITSDERRNKCYVKAAETSKDASICEKITDEDIREMCFELAEEISPLVTCKSEENMSREECHFIDDFESGLGNWDFHGEGSQSIVEEDGNKFLRLYGVIQPDLLREWDNHLFKFRFKRIEGSVHVNFRKRSIMGQSRYIVAISEGVDNLNKHVGENWPRLDDTHFSFDENWHTLEIRGYDNILNVYLDDELIYKYKDTENPLLFGMPGFEIHTGGRPITPEFLIDDVEVRFIEEGDVVYP